MNWDYCKLMCAYNRGANERIYDACAQLNEDELRVERRVFFGSVLGTLNHLMIGDRIWMTRFEGGEIPSTSLDGILHDNFDELREARVAMDERISLFFEDVNEDFFEGVIEYVNNAGKLYADAVAMLSVHFFNHQTHHRGQVHAMLTQTAVQPPVLDLHRVIQP